jgi:hypothetical protein
MPMVLIFYIHVENPQLVVDSIRTVVDHVRGPGRRSSSSPRWRSGRGGSVVTASFG